MSELTDKQWRHVKMTSLLILYADQKGWTMSWAEAYRDPRATWGSENSLHHDRLAIDLNLFVDGEYIDGLKDGVRSEREYRMWEALGLFWEGMGGSWGGRFVSGPNAGDLNHFSIEHNGRR